MISAGITFKDIINNKYVDEKLLNSNWFTQTFNGFCMDIGKLEKEQIFITTIHYNNESMGQVALDSGALAIITERDYLKDTSKQQQWVCKEISFLIGEWQKKYLNLKNGLNCSSLSVVPQQQLPPHIVAVTGTNGKTTTTQLIAQLVESVARKRCAVMGTVGNGFLDNLKPTGFTTCFPLELQEAIQNYVQEGACCVSMEASSHGIHQGRLLGTDITVGVYTNLSRDHLDYHETMEEYSNVKASLFKFKSLKTVVINIDDSYAPLMLSAAQGNDSKPKILTYSVSQSSKADYCASNIEYTLNGTCFTLTTPTGIHNIVSPLIGSFNVENLLASLIAVESCGFHLCDLVQHIPKLQPPPGRLQMIRDNKGRTFVVDYAHSPDSLEKVLKTLKELLPKPSDHQAASPQLWTVFCCGGDRDRGKRPTMTRVALDYSNVVVITSGNLRTESIDHIIKDMKDGIDFSKYTHIPIHEIHDRRESIKFAIENAKHGDIIAITGKGHEKHQEINGIKYEMDDVFEIKNNLNLL